ncbi:hypothetical protein [Psychromonas sp. MME2]|uniref:hypothetical protein n=1 Tax=unclassified Psychromonas TaxID=2614957 RepID=UPI00339CE4CF
MKIKLLLILCTTLLVSGCGDDRPEKLKSNIQTADYLLNNLANDLDNNRIRNGMLLREYARLLAQQKAELQPLLQQLSLDASRSGPMMQGLLQRSQTLKEQPQVLGDIEAQLLESENLIAASDPALFNDALSDPINVIADMSDGQLARVNAISKQQSLRANGAEDSGPGSQLVGNPGYGQWQTNSSGISFWQWYGMYAMFSALSPRPVQYDRWSSRRDYSYYNDYGRNRYTSPQQAKAQDNLATKTRKQFANKGGFKSPYAKSKTGASSISNSSRQAQKATPFAGKSSFSKAKSSSSFRNSKSTTSRGFRRGK